MMRNFEVCESNKAKEGKKKQNKRKSGNDSESESIYMGMYV